MNGVAVAGRLGSDVNQIAPAETGFNPVSGSAGKLQAVSVKTRKIRTSIIFRILIFLPGWVA